MKQYMALWDSPEGLAKCYIAGMMGIIIFSAFGVAMLRKKEI